LTHNNSNQLAFNVGYLLHQVRGYSRQYDFTLPSVRLDEDLMLQNLQGTLQLTRSADGLLTQGTFQADTEMECNRCLELFLQPLVVDISELMIYPASQAEDPVLGIPETGLFDLRPLLRESFLVTLPIQPLCKQNCQGLCPLCGNNLNQSSCTHETDEIDPRMEELKKLLE
jgi:uncharacterized protein